MNDWDIDKARAVYNIAHWSSGYFDVNDNGHLAAYPDGHTGIDLYTLSAEIKAAGLSLPVLVRFSNILHDRVDTLCRAFSRAMGDHAYRGTYTAVYPIKVNQQRSVVDEILAHGQERVGLEAGSKPELLAVLARVRQDGGMVVCNGYKDREYIRLALIGRALGHRVYIVVEKLSELELVIAESRALAIEPLIGLRARLASIGTGNWQNTGGAKSKFGLSAAQVLRLLARLRQTDMLPALQMLHFHMGSQIPTLGDIRSGLREGARFYSELRGHGANIQVVNVGGGLGVDYEGMHSDSFCSMNYSVQEYADSIVGGLQEICTHQNLPCPDIVTEAGRAMVAHHAMLITNVVDTEHTADGAPEAPTSQDEAVQTLWRACQADDEDLPVESYYIATDLLAKVQAGFSEGRLDLDARAQAEHAFYALCRRLRALLRPGKKEHKKILDALNVRLADKYFCNFSLFQSMPDAWAIGQVFPVVPLHRLGDRPTRRGVLEDITCDSDGRLDLYPDAEGVESSLPLHPLKDGEPYLLGIFLLGAYQEILGDMHNLFGDTDSVHVELTPDGGHRLVQARRGDGVDALLRYVHFDPEELLESYKLKIATADLNTGQEDQFLSELAEGLKGYTYLED